MLPTSADLSRLKRDGIVPMGTLKGVDDAEDYLQRWPTVAGHVRRATPQNSPDCCCYSMAAVLKLPGFLRFALGLTDFAKRYLEAEPLLYSVNAFWTKPARPIHPGLQEFHRDQDDDRQLTVFIYGTDISELDDGAHEFKRGTHDDAETGEVIPVLGPRMTWFLVDTRGLHRGRMPVGHERLLLWARWGITDPPRSYVKDGIKPVPCEDVPDYPADPYLQHVIRLVAA